MLEKHKKMIEKYILNNNEVNNVYSLVGGNNNYSFEVFNNELKINIDDNTILSNNDDGIISVWNIKEGYNNTALIINRVDSLDVVAIIQIVDCSNNLVNVAIKQTPTNMYISYADESIGYDVNKCNTNFIINIIKDYFNKKRLLRYKNKEDIFNFIRVDIDEIFAILYNNKNNYINNLEHELNSLNASYVIESKSIKRKLKTISSYNNRVIDK